MVMGPKTELVLERKTQTADGQGGYIESWQDLRKIRGILVPLKGLERMITGKTEVFATHKFFMDYPKDLTITEKDRFILGTREFEIKFIADPAEQHIHLEIELWEVT